MKERSEKQKAQANKISKAYGNELSLIYIKKEAARQFNEKYLVREYDEESIDYGTYDWVPPTGE
jgi:hypothetical protein